MFSDADVLYGMNYRAKSSTCPLEEDRVELTAVNNSPGLRDRRAEIDPEISTFLEVISSVLRRGNTSQKIVEHISFSSSEQDVDGRALGMLVGVCCKMMNYKPSLTSCFCLCEHIKGLYSLWSSYINAALSLLDVTSASFFSYRRELSVSVPVRSLLLDTGFKTGIWAVQWHFFKNRQRWRKYSDPVLCYSVTLLQVKVLH